MCPLIKKLSTTKMEDQEGKKVPEFDLFLSWLPLHIKRLKLQQHLRCKQHLYFLPLDLPVALSILVEHKDMTMR